MPPRATPCRSTAAHACGRALALAGLVLGLSACGTASGLGRRGPVLADPTATRETRALFANLQRLAPDHVLFGHHDDLAYGFTWRGEPGRSDVREVAGSYPAVYGWDVNRLFHRGRLDAPSPDGARQLRAWILEGFERGGVATLCWHMDNPVSGGNAWDTTRAVAALLPGGERHALYRASLDVLADFLKSLVPEGGRRRLAPVIFRPFHEHTGHWFWWGARHSTVEEFVALWRFTVEYLRDEKDVHNLLYAYSTDVFDSEEAYLERYPGDAYIDLLGFDDYHSVRSDSTRDVLVRRLRTVAGLARERGKLAALTETGVEAVPDSAWWTDVLLPALKSDSVGGGIAFALVWRNANNETDRPGHFYAPYPGHPSAPDFVRFYRDPFVLFEDELPDLYDSP
jgi:mannan endo-1,4-beta-mannosidase